MNYAAVLDLSKRNMLLPIYVNLCCLVFNHVMSKNYALLPVFQNYFAILNFSWRNVLLLMSENLCCLDLNHDGVYLNLLSYTSAERTAQWTPMCLHYSLYSWWKNEQVFQRDVFRLRDSSKSFFHSYNTSFLSCKYHLLCSLKTYQFLVIHEWSGVFSKQFVSLLLDRVFWLVANIAIILATSVFLKNFVTPFYLFGNK